MSSLYLIHRGRPEPPEGRTSPGLNHRIGVSSEPLSEELIAARIEIECLQQTSIGPLFSVAHYFEQNGDLVPDPDVVFVRAADGWAPVSFQNLLAYRIAVRRIHVTYGHDLVRGDFVGRVEQVAHSAAGSNDSNAKCVVGPERPG